VSPRLRLNDFRGCADAMRFTSSRRFGGCAGIVAVLQPRSGILLFPVNEIVQFFAHNFRIAVSPMVAPDPGRLCSLAFTLASVFGYPGGDNDRLILVAVHFALPP